MKQPLSTASSLVLRKARLSPHFFITSVAFVLLVAVLYGEYFMSLLGGLDTNSDQPVKRTGKKWEMLSFAIGRSPQGCDVFEGRWVRDESTRPLYEESECPYIDPQLTCQEHGRPDRDYLYWRWQPYGCDLPSFNATLMLETLRGKRMMFVGDSLNRGQYASMICLLHRSIPEDSKSKETFGSLTVFTIKNYNATIEFYWAPYLLESNSDVAYIQRSSDRIVRKDSINKHGKHWKGVDILVFDTYLWWTADLKINILKGSFDDEVKEIVEMSSEDAYRMAMKNMLRWVRKNMNPKKTRVFFMGMSPTHAMSTYWGGEPGHNCYNETTMLSDAKFWELDVRRNNIMRMVGQMFGRSKFPITFLNITQLSSYRKDAHTSIYKKHWTPLTPERLANPASYADCIHWCLPGLQDVWNELLYAKLFYP